MTSELEITGTFNLEKLKADLLAQIGAPTYEGLRTAKGKIYLLIGAGTTTQQQSAILALVAAHNPALLSPGETLREAIKTTAQSAVGVTYDQLTAAQVRALAAILLYKAGALDTNGTVRPLSEWVR